MNAICVTIGIADNFDVVHKVDDALESHHVPLNSTGTVTAICRTAALSTYTVMPELKASITLE